MPRRVPTRLVRLLALACACLAPAAAAHAAAPPNDLPTSAQIVPELAWTSLSVPQDIPVQATDWGDATTGPEDADPLPSCTGAIGFRSMWYKLKIPEAAVLRVTVVSTDLARYQPVVTILDPMREEVACGLAAIGKAGATANATAYVAPLPDGSDTYYLVRVAQVTNNSPLGGLPMLTVRFAARDVTPPHVRVAFPLLRVAPGVSTVYDALGATDAPGTTDAASGVDAESATWEFHDKVAGRSVMRTRKGLRVSYTWHAEGTHPVMFTVSDRAGNVNVYRFTTVVQDTTAPVVSFALQPPEPGARRLRVVVRSSESVRLRLLVTQVGRSGVLLRRVVRFWGDGTHKRSIRLNGAVGRGLLVISGIARDRAGNATGLGHCVVDPVSGGGGCPAP